MPKKIWVDPLFWHSVGGTYTDHGVEIQKTPYIRKDLVDELVEALKSLVRNGQKQGWNDKYEWDMDKAKAALAKLEESHD